MVIGLIIKWIFKAIDILQLLIVIRCILSWVPDIGRNKLGQIIYKITEPFLAPFRKLMPRNTPVDISPILLFAAIYFARRFLWILLR